ncbi:MAG TPA: Calx-beta domain-containing protein [Ohtaekwangia sp.]|uniref:Calx-beta domain-containing protein n=1 Tax=Ohtaekwangia sp. TaxID=2066019 RepID=UPI002F949EB4
MRKFSMLTLSILTLGAFGVMLSSCGKDDEPTTYQLTFSKTSDAVSESAGTLDVTVTLDKAAPEDLTVKYSIDGTTTDETEATSTDPEDFSIDGDLGEVVIKKGETTGTISLILYSDDLLEDDETIKFTISSVNNSNVKLTTNQSIEITLQQEDGVVVLLEWPDASTDGVADMDLLVRMGETANDWDGILTGSVFRGYNYNYEFVFIPPTFTGTYFGLTYTNSTYGLSYTYYDGSLDPLNFTATFIDFKNGALENESTRDVYEGSYTAANKNKWVNGTPPTIIAQTFRNVSGAFTEISDITVQESSSRVSSKAANTFLQKNGSGESKLRVITNLPQRMRSLIH